MLIIWTDRKIRLAVAYDAEPHDQKRPIIANRL